MNENIKLNQVEEDFLKMPMISEYINNDEWDEVAFYMETRLNPLNIVNICKLLFKLKFKDILKYRVYYKSVFKLIEAAIKLQGFDAFIDIDKWRVVLFVIDNNRNRYRYFYNFATDEWHIEKLYNMDILEWERKGSHWNDLLEAFIFFNTPLKTLKVEGFKI